MAPRRGGYGGSSIGGGIQSCKDNDAFDSPYTIALMAFIAFFFLVFLAQTWSVFRCKRNNNGGWFILAGSTILMFIGVIIKLVIIPTYECGSMTTADYNATSIAISWLIGYASLLLVATIMVPVCRIATQGSKLIRILNTAYIVFLSLLWAITLAIATKLTVDDDDYYGYSSYNLQRALNGLIIARGIFMVIGVLIAGLVIIVQTLRKSHLRKGVVPLLMIVHIGSTLAFTLCDFGSYINQRYSTPTIVSALVAFFLYYLFFAVAIGSATFIISSPHLTAERKFPSHIPPPPTSYGPHYHFVPQNDRQ